MQTNLDLWPILVPMPDPQTRQILTDYGALSRLVHTILVNGGSIIMGVGSSGVSEIIMFIVLALSR